MDQPLRFQQITPDLAIGAAPPAWQPITAAPLVILVGVTGVGKSTLLNELAAQHVPHRLLPNRRELTDRLIITQMQMAAGEPIVPVTDRRQRFAYTRAYRERYPGGMAHALAQLWLTAQASSTCWIFDGLRGANEVKAATTELPDARFVLLDAPDLVRVQRLLGRNDVFDQVTPDPDPSAQLGCTLPEAAGILNTTEVTQLVQWASHHAIPLDEVRAKLQIVAEERRNYDPVAALEALRRHAPGRLLYLDTVAHAPVTLAQTLSSWLAQ